MAMLTTESLSKRFGELTAVDDVTINVDEGEFHSLIGPNGAGKTTFFNLVTGGLYPSSGRITFDNVDITSYDPHEIARLGCSRSFQITSIFPSLTVFENLRVMAQARSEQRTSLFAKKNTLAEPADRAAEIVGTLGLSDVRDQTAEELSHGQKRSLELGLTLAMEPKLLMLDEPTAGMGREETLELTELLENLSSKYTVFIIEHDMDVVISLSDQITVLHKGSIITSGPPEEVTENEEVNKAYLGEEIDV